MHAIIVENDISQWKDDTGVLYHFPKKYLTILQPGTKVIYYKGGIKQKKYQQSRLSNAPHYFGLGTIGKVFKDKESHKNDYFATIESFEKFLDPVLAKIEGKYLESIPENQSSNYWRNGVRAVSKDNYEYILDHLSESGTEFSDERNDGEYNNKFNMFESLHDGDPRKRYVTIYERNPKLRRQAIAIHGCSCAACGFDFYEVYGAVGEGYIHIHHKKPVSQLGGPKQIDPEMDLIPLCANCHAMVHRIKMKTLSIEELKSLLK